MSTCPQCRAVYPPHVRICSADGTVLEEEPVPQADPNVGVLLAGKYRLDALLGRGGMGAVYQATHVMLGKTVAVKMIKPDLVGSPEMVRRFQREARAATSLDHPNIVAVHDLGEAEDGTLYIAMEFVQGQSLKDAIRVGGPMEPSRIARLLSQVASALAKAHNRQVVHRDLKPHNLVLTIDGNGQECVKLLDFGIAKTFEEGATQLTAAGYALGTPQYMAPEQATGKEVDGRADIYALGVILYEMLVGDVPFNDASTPAILIKHMTEAPQPPSRRRPGIHPALEALALRCLEKDPQRRFQRAEEFAAALKEAFPRDAATPLPAVFDAPTVTRPPTSDLGGTVQASPAVSPAPAVTLDDTRDAAVAAAAGSSPAEAAMAPGAGHPVVGAPGSPAATRPTEKMADPVMASAAGIGSRRSGSVSRLLVVLGGVAALLLLAVGAAGYVTYRAWNARAMPATSEMASADAPSSTPAMAAGEGTQASSAEPHAPSAGAPEAPDPAQPPRPGGEQRAPEVLHAQPAAVERAPSARGQAADGRAVGSAPRSAGPVDPPVAAETATTVAPGSEARSGAVPTAPPIPEHPSVLVECAGAPDVCGAVRAAFDQALERQRMPSVRRAERADVVVTVAAALLDTRHDQQFGTTFAVQTYGLEVSAETAHDGEAVGMPASRTFSFDSRFGRERAAENARIVAGEAVERIGRFWSTRRGR